MEKVGAIILLWLFCAGAGALLGWTRLRAHSQGGVWEFVSLLVLLTPTIAFEKQLWVPMLMGVCFGLGYAVRMLIPLRLPVAVSVILAYSQTFVWTLFVLGAAKLWHLPSPLDVVAIACLGTALLWLEWTLLPLWGTAQNFACSFPINRPFISWFGAAGGTWSLIFVAALGALAQKDKVYQLHQWGVAFVLTAFIVVCFALNWLNQSLDAKNTRTLRIATFGWSGMAFDALITLPAEYQNAAREASERGARLLVTPEAAIRVADRAHFRVALCTLALTYKIALAVGYFDDKANENCIDFVSAQGEVVGRYVKTHLVPVFERYKKGRGEPVLMDVDGVSVGGMVCQDDNFPDIARRYGKAGAQLLAVPTNDWRGVKDVHFANHRWRALENRYALVRATSDGVSALSSFDGRVAASSDHFKDGPNLLVADVRVGNGRPTLYARTGDWFPIMCGLAALVGLWLAR